MDYTPIPIDNDGPGPATMRDLLGVLRETEREFVDLAAKVSDSRLATLLYRWGADLGRWQRELNPRTVQPRSAQPRTMPPWPASPTARGGTDLRGELRESIARGDNYRLLCDLDKTFGQLIELYSELIASWESTDLQPVLMAQQRDLRCARRTLQRMREQHNPYLYTVDLRDPAEISRATLRDSRDRETF